LNPDGSLDTSFPPSVQRDEEADYAMVSAIVIQDGDRALIGGANMVTPNGFDAGDLLRIHLGEPVPPRLSILQAPSGMLQLTYSYSGSAEFAVLTTTNIALPASNWTVLGSATNAGGNLYRLSDQLSPSESHRFYRLRGATPR
jgi:hypothetical protein